MNKSEFAEVQVSKSWPSPQDYNEAMQSPAINLAAPELKVGKPGLNNLGLPKAITGSFASVYYLDCPKQDFAVRCFLHNIANQQERYAKISDYLNHLNLPIMADFDYLEKGILCHGKWLPILKMDWVDGQNLIEYIGRNLDNAKVLEELRLWLRQARGTLKEHGIAHGDLQHGNVLVGNDSIKLVDYDGMFVPALAGELSNELGHRNYQHPGRTKETFGPHLDNFSAWLIDSCLYILQRDPRVWFTLHAGEDCLLFREKDLQDPYSSFAFHELESHSNSEIRERTKLLRWLLTLPVDQIPDIDEQVQVPEDLVQLDPAKKKPDWLTSAQHLMAEEIGISKNVFVEEPAVPLSTQRKPYVASWWKKHPYNPANQSSGGPPNVLTPPPYLSQHNTLAAIVMSILAFIGVGVIFSAMLAVGPLSKLNTTEPYPVREVVKMDDAQILFDKGTAEYRASNYSMALKYYQDTLGILKDSGKGKSVEAANCYYWIGRMQMQLGKYEDAAASLSASGPLYEDYGLTADVATVNHTYGLVLLRQKNYKDSIVWFQAALEDFERQPRSQYYEDCKAEVGYCLGMAYAGNHQDKEATQIFKRLIDYYDGVTEKQPNFVLTRLNDIERYFTKHNQTSLAQKARRVANEISFIHGTTPGVKSNGP